jgi:hypothetical protein
MTESIERLVAGTALVSVGTALVSVGSALLAGVLLLVGGWYYLTSDQPEQVEQD